MATTVEDLMTRSVIAVRPETTLDVARRALDEGRMRHLPVVDGERRVVGVLSDRDLLDPRFGDAALVATVMSAEVQTVFNDTPAYEAAAVMLHHRFGCLPVIDTERRLIGLVTETDLLMEAHALLSLGDTAPVATDAHLRIEHARLRVLVGRVEGARYPDTAVPALTELYEFMERHFAREEARLGLFARILEALPDLAPEVASLADQHATMLASTLAIIEDNRFLATSGSVDVSADVRRLVSLLEAHEAREAELLRRVVATLSLEEERGEVAAG